MHSGRRERVVPQRLVRQRGPSRVPWIARLIEPARCQSCSGPHSSI